MLLKIHKTRLLNIALILAVLIGWFESIPAKATPSVVFGWAKRIGGTSNDIGQAITVDGNGNVYATGFFYSTVDFDPGAGAYNLTSAGLGDSFVSKLDSNGNLIWAKRMGGTGGDWGDSIAVDGNGNAYTIGVFSGTADFDPGTGVYNLTSVGAWDIFISKLDINGNFVWAKGLGGTGGTTGDDFGTGIAVDGSGNVYTTGSFEGTLDFDPGVGIYNMTSAGINDIFVSKLDGNGNLIWAKRIGGTSVDMSHALVLDGSGNVYTTGYFFSTTDFDPGAGTVNLTSAGSADIFISKLNGNGNFAWAKRMGGDKSDWGYALAVDGNGNVHTTGYFETMADFDPNAGTSYLTSAGLSDIFISKLNNDGNFAWAKRIGGTGGERGHSLMVDGNGNVYTTGYFFGTVDFEPNAGVYNLTSNGGLDIFVSKLDGNGGFAWAKNMGGLASDRGHGIAVDGNENVFTAGEFQSSADFDPGAGTSYLTSEGYEDIFITKLTAVSHVAISGNVGAADVTLSYTDDILKTVTSSRNGSYSLPVSYNWSGTVTPTHPCYTFSPANRPYSNVTTNQTAQNYTPILNPASGCAEINVTIAGANQGKFGILPGASTRASFSGIDNGPVKVSSTNSMDILTALRVIWKEPGFRASYSEMMGLPAEQLSSEYWFPWYNNAVPSSMDQGFRIANVDSDSNTVEIYVGSSLLNTLNLSAGQSVRVGFTVDNGPIRIVCTTCSNTGTDKIIAALRVIWKEPGQRYSYSEMMGLPKEQLSSEYWFPWYNNLAVNSMDQGFRIANVDTTTSNTVEVWVGPTKLDTITLAAGASIRKGYNVDNGPIRISCTTCSNTATDKIIAALRVIWKEPGFRASYSEMMGLPKEQLSDEYWFPWYNNAVPASMDQGFRIANVSSTESNTVEVWVGSTKLATISLAAGASTRVGYNVDNGPIRIVCTTCTNTGDDQILAALRVIWKEPGFRASYSEMMGLPAQALSTEYWFPWYNFAAPNSMDQGFRIAAP